MVYFHSHVAPKTTRLLRPPPPPPQSLRLSLDFLLFNAKKDLKFFIKVNEKEYLENEKTLPIVLPILEQSFSSVQAFLHAVDDDRIGSQEPVVCDRASANWALRSKKNSVQI